MTGTPIITALCSFGMSGKVFHAPFLAANEGFNLYGVWERSSKTMHEFYPGVTSFNSLEEMLADEKIELVIVNTPNYSHYEYAKKALLAGKHIIVEKPFVAQSQEGEELVQIAKEQNKIIGVYHNRRWDSDFNLVKQVLDQKLLGDVVEAEIHYDRYKEELSPKVHKETPGPATGTLYDLGSHLIDQSLQLFGKPDAVFADITIMRPYSRVDDYFELLMYYPGKRVRLKASYQILEPLPSFVLHGTNGSFIKQRADVQEDDLIAGKKPDDTSWGIEPENAKGLLHIKKDGKTIKEFLPSPKGDYMNYFNAFYRAIRLGEQPPVSARDGINVIKVIEAAFESSKTQKVVQVTF